MAKAPEEVKIEKAEERLEMEEAIWSKLSSRLEALEKKPDALSPEQIKTLFDRLDAAETRMLAIRPATTEQVERKTALSEKIEEKKNWLDDLLDSSFNHIFDEEPEEEEDGTAQKK